MPFVGAPACLPAIGFCDQREQIPIAPRVCCASSTRGGRHAGWRRKRASTTERPLPPHAGVGGSPRTTRSGLVATKRVICCAPLRVWAGAHEQASTSERVIFCRLLRVWAGSHEQASVSERVTFCRIYGSGVVMPFVGAPACLPAIGFCDQREQIPIASRVSCNSRTRGGRHAVAGRKRASTTERPLLRYFGKRTRRAGTPQPWRRKRRGGNRAAKRVRGVARHRRPRPRR